METHIKILILAACGLVGYLFGCFSLSYILARRRGFDIRTRGSNNAGASNATLTMGKRAGIAVGFSDIAKAFVCVAAATLLFPTLTTVPYITGFMCVIGHMHPFYMGFRGGKGFASYIGVMLAVNWRFGLLVCIGILIVSLISDYIVMGTMLTVITFPIYILILDKNIPGFILIACLSALIIFRHRKNLVSIANGTEVGIRSAFKGKKENNQNNQNNQNNEGKE